MLYKVLSAFEDAGRCQRGYFVESLGGAQFAVASTVDRLRTYLDDVDQERRDYQAVVLAAADPANPYGAALPWPADGAHRPGRKAGALVVLVDGELVWFLERGGRTLLSYSDDPDAQSGRGGRARGHGRRAGGCSRCSWRRSTASRCSIPAQTTAASTVRDALTGSGFARTPRGLRLR